MINQDRVFKLADGISFQSLGVGEGAVVLEVASGQLHTCNDTTAEFLGALDGKRSYGEVISLLQQRFEVGRDVLEADIGELARQLFEQHVIV